MWTKTFIVFIGICAVSLSGCDSRWSSSRVESSKKKGSGIVAAIDRYKSDHGKFPENLSQLVPQYIDRIEKPDAGDMDWLYETDVDGKDFSLWVKCRETDKPSTTHEPNFEHLEYLNERKAWHFHQGF
jgi:hypothetical protein